MNFRKQYSQSGKNTQKHAKMPKFRHFGYKIKQKNQKQQECLFFRVFNLVYLQFNVAHFL